MSKRIRTRISMSGPILLVTVLIVLASFAALACATEPTPTASDVTLFPPPTATPEVSDPVRQSTPLEGGSTPEPSPATEGTETATVTRPADSSATSTSEPTPLNADDLGHLPDDPSELMFATLESSLTDVGRKMAYSHDDSFIPVLMDIMRLQRSAEGRLTLASYLVRIRDRLPREEPAIIPPGQEAWDWWQEWLAQNPDVSAPPGFDEWKGTLFSLVIDPAMGAFFYENVPTTIRVEEIVWGGVRRDGIPDLRFPPPLAPEEAAFLDPGDRVFGVSINGEHRAYPLRVLNAHEMANDTLGGVQFALAY